MHDRFASRRLDPRTCALLVACLCACSSPRTVVLPAPLPPAPLAPSAERYRIQPGDELELRFFHTPQYDLVVPVRPDGYLSVPLVPELLAAGRTVEELRVELLDRYRAEFAEPELAVIVRTFTPYQVHVGGEVDSPGVIELSGTRSLLEAVFAAGGFKPNADPSEVLLVRRTEPAGYEIIAADLQAMLDGRSAEGNPTLRPFDVVYVPNSPIGEVNRWVDLYIRKTIPINFSYRVDLER